jgi:hypothetical protein
MLLPSFVRSSSEICHQLTASPSPSTFLFSFAAPSMIRSAPLPSSLARRIRFRRIRSLASLSGISSSVTFGRLRCQSTLACLVRRLLLGRGDPPNLTLRFPVYCDSACAATDETDPIFALLSAYANRTAATPVASVLHPVDSHSLERPRASFPIGSLAGKTGCCPAPVLHLPALLRSAHLGRMLVLSALPRSSARHSRPRYAPSAPVLHLPALLRSAPPTTSCLSQMLRYAPLCPIPILGPERSSSPLPSWRVWRFLPVRAVPFEPDFAIDCFRALRLT